MVIHWLKERVDFTVLLNKVRFHSTCLGFMETYGGPYPSKIHLKK